MNPASRKVIVSALTGNPTMTWVPWGVLPGRSFHVQHLIE